MKKFIFCLAAATMALGFTACEDVPAPYGINNVKPNDNNSDALILNEAFASSLGTFTTAQTVGNYPFAVDGSYGYVKVTSFEGSGSTGTNNAAESWLISPKFSLKNVEKAHVTFDYILRYATASELKTNYLVRFSDNYAGDAAAATWTDVSFNPVQVGDWTTWTTADVDVPTEMIGKENLTLALYYKADAKSATWELKNFKLLPGAAASNDVDQSVRTLPYSEAFANSLGGFTNYTTSGKGAWTIDYSTAKAAGYDNSTKETTAGTYYIVSPEISLEGQTAAHVSYEYILRYNKADDNQQVLISTVFNGETPTEGWTLLTQTHTEGSDWSTFSKQDVAIPSEYMGKKIRLAFRYNCAAEGGSTWEVKNFSIAAGSPGSTAPNQPGGDVSANSISINASDFGIANNEAVSVIKLSDGTELSFDGGGAQNTPKYFTNGTNVRMYPKNTMTVTSSKTIASVTIVCDVVSGVTCNASGNVSAEPGTVTVNDVNLVVTGINAMKSVITNNSTTTGPASQIRFKSITITYAN